MSLWRVIGILHRFETGPNERQLLWGPAEILILIAKHIVRNLPRMRRTPDAEAEHGEETVGASTLRDPKHDLLLGMMSRRKDPPLVLKGVDGLKAAVGEKL